MVSPIPPIDVAKAAFNMLVTGANQGDTALPDDSSRSILAFDNHIRAVEAMIVFMLTEANDHLSTLKQSRNALAPIHGLPDEVIVDVWLHCVEDASCDGSRVDEQLKTLALVCKSWHRGVLDHSVLWCYLQDTCKSEYYNDCVLRKSQNCPLHLRLLAQDASVSDSLLNIAMPECRRWKSLVLAPKQARGSRTREPHLDILADANLENLTGFEIQPRTSSILPRPISLPATPALREVKLERFPLRWETFNAPQLRALRISSLPADTVSFHQLVDLLRSTPFLEILLLKDTNTATGLPKFFHQKEPPIILPRLRALFLFGVPYSDLLPLMQTDNLQQLLNRPASYNLWKPPQSPILNNIKATGVVNLVYRDSVHIVTDPHPFYPIEWPYHDEVLTTEGFALTTTKGVGVRDFVHITEWVGSLGAHTIVNLELKNPQRSIVGFRTIPVALLDHLPTLRSLVIGEGVNVDVLFTQLGRPKRESSGRLHWPWPQLANLTLSDADLIGPQILIDLAQSRWGTGSIAPSIPEPSINEERPPKLKSLSIPDRFPDEIRRRLETLAFGRGFRRVRFQANSNNSTLTDQ